MKTYLNLETIDGIHNINILAEEKMLLQTRMHRRCWVVFQIMLSKKKISDRPSVRTHDIEVSGKTGEVCVKRNVIKFLGKKTAAVNIYI